MSTSKYISIIHVAEAPGEDGVQRCFRCGVELSKKPLMFWQTGHRIGQGFNTENGETTGGWIDFDTPECVGVEPGDIECPQDT